MPVNKPEAQNPSYYFSILILGILFFIFGFISWLNAILIPYFKLACELSVQQAMLVASAFYISYFIMAFPSSYILKKTGYKNGMVLGLIVMAAGALIFIPAALSRTYGIFLLGLFVQATGLTLLQTAANPYIIIIGPIESAARRMGIMGICNKVAGAIAPLILLGFMVKNPDEIDHLQKQLPLLSTPEVNSVLNNLVHRLILPYSLMAGALVGLGLMIKLTHLPDIQDDDLQQQEKLPQKENGAGLFQFKHLILGAIAIFCGVSVEVLVVDSIINYGQFSGLSFREAKYFASYTLIIMITGYSAGIIAIPKWINQRTALIISASLGIALSVLLLTTRGTLSIWCISLLGLGNALLWPSIWALSISGLGKFTKQASALLVMGVVGGALIPALYGWLSSISNPHQAYWICIPLYLFILYFSVSGYKAGKQANIS